VLEELFVYSPLFQLNNCYLNYYGDASRSKLLGSINLTEAVGVDIVDEASGWLQIAFRSGDSTYAIKGVDCDAWADALQQRIAWCSIPARTAVQAPPSRSTIVSLSEIAIGPRSTDAVVPASNVVDPRELASLEEQLHAHFAVAATVAPTAIRQPSTAKSDEQVHTARRRLISALSASIQRALATLALRMHDASPAQRAANVQLLDDRFLSELAPLKSGAASNCGQ
jgi:hypothetical protein